MKDVYEVFAAIISEDMSFEEFDKWVRYRHMDSYDEGFQDGAYDHGNYGDDA